MRGGVQGFAGLMRARRAPQPLPAGETDRRGPAGPSGPGVHGGRCGAKSGSPDGSFGLDLNSFWSWWLDASVSLDHFSVVGADRVCVYTAVCDVVLMAGRHASCTAQKHGAAVPVLLKN